MKLTPFQWFGIALAILGVLAAGGTQMDTIFGPTLAKTISAFAGFISTILGATLMSLGSQSGMVQQVRSLDGVDSIRMNTAATPALAKLATDPAEPKIGGTDQQTQAVLTQIASRE